MVDKKEEGFIKKRTGERSYMTQSQNGVTYNRNRYHPRPIPEHTKNLQEEEDPVEIETYPTIDRNTGRHQDLENQTETANDQEPLECTRTVSSRRSRRASRPHVRYVPTWI